MANQYQLRYSSPFKSQTVIVPSAVDGSGINDYTTSLALVGPGYANYGVKYAQNFLNLLENFASPYAPENGIEGQLWYDTSDGDRKVLRVNNGTNSTARWTPASGIYQQTNDPSAQYLDELKEGDIWVDTNNAQLKIRYGTSWRIVGPDLTVGSDKTGPEFVYLESTSGDTYPVILNWSASKVVAVISSNEFTPKIVIDGFSVVKKGMTLSNKADFKYYGTSEKADSLVVTSNSVLRASDILRNKVNTSQVHTGSFIVSSANGLSVKNPTYNHTVQLYSNNVEGARLNFNSPDGVKKFTVGINQNSYITFNPESFSVGINTATSANSPAFEVNGSAKFSGTLTIESVANNSLSLSGSAVIAGNINLSGNALITGITSSTGKLLLGTSSGSGKIIEPANNLTYDIGSSSTQFRRVYAAEFGSTVSNTSVFFGNLYGTATKIATKRDMSIIGHVIAPVVKFDGSDQVVFTATITNKVFLESVSTNSFVTNHTLLVVNTSTSTSVIEGINKTTLFAEITPSLVLAGTVLGYGGTSAPSGYLLCDGTSYAIASYPALYSVIGTTYGGGGSNFNVPQMSFSTTATNNTTFIKYIIKT